MRLIDHINHLTDYGTSVLFSNKEHKMHKMTTKDEYGGGLEVVLYRSESLSQGKEAEKLLVEVTSSAITCADSQSWWKRCIKLFASTYAKEYDKTASNEEVEELYQELVNSVASKLFTMIIEERAFPSAKTMHAMLVARIKTFQKDFKAEVKDTDGKSVTFNIQGW